MPTPPTPPRQHGVSLAAQGLSLPPVKSAPGALVPATQADDLVPSASRPHIFVGPRFEPPNISAVSDAKGIQTAIRESENGETRELFRFYRDFLLGDDHVQGELNKRKMAILSQPLAVMPVEKENPNDMLAVKAVVQMISDCENWVAGIAALLDSTAIWPVAVNEMIFRPADAPRSPDQPKLQYTLKNFSPVNPMLFCFRWAYYTGGIAMGTASPVQQVGQDRGAFTIDMEQWEPWFKLWPIDDVGRIIYDASRAAYLDQTRHVVHRGHLLSNQRDNWGGPGRSLLGWIFLRQVGRDWFARFMERFGAPFPVASTDVTNEQKVDFLRNAFSAATKIFGLVIDENDRVELKEAAVSGGADGHNKWHEVCNNAISFAITGIKPMAERPSGLNSGAAHQQESIREDMRMMDQIGLGDTLVKSLIENFLFINGLTGRVKLSWGGLSDQDAATLGALLLDLSQAGIEPTDDAMLTLNERLGIAVQKKAVPRTPPMPFGALLSHLGKPEAPDDAPEKPEGKNDDADDPKKGNTPKPLHSHGQPLLLASAVAVAPTGAHPVDVIAAQRAKALGQTYRGAMAPFRQIILSSASKEEALYKLTAHYIDWAPERLAAELENALQVCAAGGAADGSAK